MEVTDSGLVGDQQLSRSHGGPDKAVYAYAGEDASWWATELGRDIPPGRFGENLRTAGLDVTGALIGERWAVGDVLLEVRMPRTPCENLSMRMGIEQFHLRFNSTGRVGALLKVLATGTISAGDQITVEERPDHGVTVADLAIGPDDRQMRRLLRRAPGPQCRGEGPSHRQPLGKRLTPVSGAERIGQVWERVTAQMSRNVSICAPREFSRSARSS